MIDEIRNEFIDISNNYYKKTGYDYWNNHVKYVEELSLILADEFDADKFIVQVSAILHDIAKPLELGDDNKHNIIGADIAMEKLSKYNIDLDKLNKIKCCIVNHTGGGTSLLSKEEWCVRNADVLSIFKDISIFYYLAYHEYKMDFENGKSFVKNMITNKYDRLDPILKERYDSLFENICDAI